MVEYILYGIMKYIHDLKYSTMNDFPMFWKKNGKILKNQSSFPNSTTKILKDSNKENDFLRNIGICDLLFTHYTLFSLLHTDYF